jgi:phosphoribosyl-dephospho-CoA transferase
VRECQRERERERKRDIAVVYYLSCVVLFCLDIYGVIISNAVIKDAVDQAKEDVNKQFQSTLNTLHDKRRPKTSADLLALMRFPKDTTLNLVVSEEIYERALDIIFRYANNITFNLTNKGEQN